MKHRFDLIIFDWDGTLIDSIEWIVVCLQTAAQICGCEVPTRQEARDVIGLSLENAIRHLFPDTVADTRKRLMAAYTSEYRSREMGREDLFPGVYEMLVRLNEAGFGLAVATGKTRAGLERALHATGTEDLFCITRCADESASKPDPRMLKDIIRYTDVSSRRALMVGDTVHDLQMAQHARISSIAVACGAHPEALLQQYRPLMCLRQPADLLNIFEG
ncbi:MAG: HAD family hydrolase [Gammaproteobacteria bacterium]